MYFVLIFINSVFEIQENCEKCSSLFDQNTQNSILLYFELLKLIENIPRNSGEWLHDLTFFQCYRLNI